MVEGSVVNNMKKQSVCTDFYNLKLEVGQRVIPICSDALFANIDGIISKINYSEYYNVWFIDISNEKGDVLLKDVNPCYYSTPERFEEREGQDYIYSLSFYNDLGHYITQIPLTRNTRSKQDMSEDIAYVTLDEKIKIESGEITTSHTEHLGIFILNQKAQIKKIENDSIIYFIQKKAYVPISLIDDCYIKEFNLEDKFYDYIRNISVLFNQPKSIEIGNNIIPYNENTSKHENVHTMQRINTKEFKQKKKLLRKEFNK